MKKILGYFTAVLLLTSIFLGACSGNNGEEPEKGAIRKMTDQVAHDLAHKIRNPIDKARSVKNQEQGRLDDMEGAAEESSRVD